MKQTIYSFGFESQLRYNASFQEVWVMDNFKRPAYIHNFKCCALWTITSKGVVGYEQIQKVGFIVTTSKGAVDRLELHKDVRFVVTTSQRGAVCGYKTSQRGVVYGQQARLEIPIIIIATTTTTSNTYHHHHYHHQVPEVEEDGQSHEQRQGGDSKAHKVDHSHWRVIHLPTENGNKHYHYRVRK